MGSQLHIEGSGWMRESESVVIQWKSGERVDKQHKDAKKIYDILRLYLPYFTLRYIYRFFRDDYDTEERSD